MTRDKDRKRITRTRMKATGESYSTARRHVMARSANKTALKSSVQAAGLVAVPSARDAERRSAGRGVPQEGVGDRAAFAGTSDDKIKQRTGYVWEEWIAMLDADGASTMRHGDIARLVHEQYGVADWWSQTVTVGYERLTGRRDRGQRMDGAYEMSKSRTFNVPVGVLFEACADGRKRRRWLEGIDATVRSKTAAKSMRLQWPDGTIVALWFTGKGEAKSNLAVAHTKLTSREALDKAKGEWSAHLDRLARLLAI